MLKSDYRMQSDYTGLGGAILLVAGGVVGFIANKKDSGKLFLLLGILGIVLAGLLILVAFGRVM